MVRYFIKYHGINNYYGILINAFMYPVKCSNNFSQVTSVYQESDKSRKLKESFTLTISHIHCTLKIEVNQCICVDVHTGIFMVYRYFYGIPVFLRYVGLPV